MKRTVLQRTAVFCIAVTLLSASIASAGMLYLINGDPAPILRGRTVQMEYFKEQWDTSTLTLVNFWATWCEPCKDEMPFLQKLSEQYPENRLRIVGINVDPKENPSIAGFLEENGIRYQVILGGEKQGRLWGGIGILPTSFLVDSQGLIAGRFKGGEMKTLDLMAARIEELLAAVPDSAGSE